MKWYTIDKQWKVKVSIESTIMIAHEKWNTLVQNITSLKLRWECEYWRMSSIVITAIMSSDDGNYLSTKGKIKQSEQYMHLITHFKENWQMQVKSQYVSITTFCVENIKEKKNSLSILPVSLKLATKITAPL